MQGLTQYVLSCPRRGLSCRYEFRGETDHQLEKLAQGPWKGEGHQLNLEGQMGHGRAKRLIVIN